MRARSQRSEARGQATGTRACRLQRWRPDALVGWLLACLLMTMSYASAAEPSARAAFDAGLQAFATSNYPAASNAFLQAAAAAPAAKLDPAAAFYNAALAAYAAGDLNAAADSFARAAAGADLALQSKAYYNRGNALFHQAGSPAARMPAMATASTQETAGAESAIGEAIQMFENAIALDPKDVDAKANYELAVLKQQQLQQQKQDQQQQDQQSPQDQPQEEPQDQKQEQPQQPPQAEQQPQPQPEQPEQQQEERQQTQEEKPSEEMTPEEAAMMLDAMKAQEQSQRDRLHPFFGRPVPVEKDW